MNVRLVTSAVAAGLISALGGCFTPVDERQCSALEPCGSGWQCVDARCVPPGAVGGGATAGGNVSGGNVSGGTAGGNVSGGFAGGRPVGGGGSMFGGGGVMVGGGGGRPVGGGFAGGFGGGGGLPMAGGFAGGFGGGGACAGCLLQGACINPEGTVLCGSGGSQCTECQGPSGNETCQGGVCRPSMGCSMMSCPGCCSMDQCLPLEVGFNFACGRGGEECMQCPAGTNCEQGRCVPGPPCGPATCMSCCYMGSCLPPFVLNESICGSNGTTCSPCGPGQACIGGRCSGSSCDRTSCPNGCCDPSGRCVRFSAQTQGQCGTGGALCASCVGMNECRGGVCQPPRCSAATCPGGCCAGDTCVPLGAQSGFVCGANGSVCTSCPNGFSCSGGRCLAPFDGGTTCSPATCAGCCANGICQPGASNFACGRFGQVCQACPGNSVCSNGVCQRPVDAGLPSFDAGVGLLPGAACTDSQQCTPLGGALCLPWPQGYCTTTCGGTSCAAWTSCPGICPGLALCIGSGAASPSFCASSCPSPGVGRSTCRVGYVCAAASSVAGICRPACTNQGFGCPGGGTCNVGTGYCE